MKKILMTFVVIILVFNGFGEFVSADLDKTNLSVLTNNAYTNVSTLIADFVISQVIEIDINGNVIWEYNEASTPIDVERLDNGNTLIVESYGQERVIEVDIDGNVVWEYKGEVFPFHPADAERLQNGNTLITFGKLNQRGIIEVDINGNIVWEYDCNGLFYTGDLERLENGNTLMIISVTENDTCVIEVDINGNVVWDYKGEVSPFHPADAERLQNGNTLIANYNGLVIEIDINKNIIWEYNETNSTIDAERLYNGNTLIVDSRDARVIEVDNDGNLVWEYVMVNEPSDVERIDNQPPDKPSIDGPISGKLNTEYEFSFNATDPNDDAVMYIIDWGDDNTEWTEYGNSGVEFILKHSWGASGKYTIKVQAIDFYGASSEWSKLSVTMPRDKTFNSILLSLYNFLQFKPNLIPILRQILGLI
jgi:predicted Rdx family selenoprotein